MWLAWSAWKGGRTQDLAMETDKQFCKLFTAAEARADDLRQMIQRREEDLRHYEELFRSGAIQQAAFHDLTQRAQRELEEFRSELDGNGLG
jgi:hypothetical protein